LITLSVVLGDNVHLMHAAVDLDDQPRTVADEVDDVVADRRLAAEAQTVEPSQFSPQLLFSECRLIPKSPCGSTGAIA
jgi:hypothetical protein